MSAMAVLAVTACGEGTRTDADLDAVRESNAWYKQRVSTSNAAPAGLYHQAVEELDVRGVGDSAWTRGGAPGNRYERPLSAGFGGAMARVDPDQ